MSGSDVDWQLLFANVICRYFVDCKMVPKWSKMVPKTVQDGPIPRQVAEEHFETTHDGPKMTRRPPKMALRHTLGSFWDLQERSWGLLGRSGAAPEPSWGGLGTSWGASKSIRKSIRHRAEPETAKIAQTLRLPMFQRGRNLIGIQIRSAAEPIYPPKDLISFPLLICCLVALIISIDVGKRCGRAAPFANVICRYFVDCNGPKVVEIGPQDRSRWPKTAPSHRRAPRDHPRWPQDGTSTAQDGPQTHFGRLLGPRKAILGPPGAVWGSS